MAPKAGKKPAEKKPVEKPGESTVAEEEAALSESAPLEKKAKEKASPRARKTPESSPSAKKAKEKASPRAGKKISKHGGGELEKKKRGRKRKNVESYKSYLYKVLKQVHPDIGISNKGMHIMNCFMIDIMEKMAAESSNLVKYGKKQTMTKRDVMSAVKLILPGELAKHGVVEGGKAITKFDSFKP